MVSDLQELAVVRDAMVPMTRVGSKARGIDDKRHDERKKTAIRFEIGSHARQRYGQFTGAHIVDDSFGHIEWLEFFFREVTRRKLLDEIGVFFDEWRDVCPRNGNRIIWL